MNINFCKIIGDKMEEKINQKISDLKEIIANRQHKPDTIKLCEQKIAELEKIVSVN